MFGLQFTGWNYTSGGRKTETLKELVVLRFRILFWLRMKNVSIKQYPEDPSAEWISCRCWPGQMLLLLLQKCSDISATLCSIFWLYKSFSPLTFSIFRDVWFNKTWFIRDVSMFVPEPIGRLIRAGNETSRSFKLYNHGSPQISRLKIELIMQENIIKGQSLLIRISLMLTNLPIPYGLCPFWFIIVS